MGDSHPTQTVMESNPWMRERSGIKLLLQLMKHTHIKVTIHLIQTGSEELKYVFG